MIRAAAVILLYDRIEQKKRGGEGASHSYCFSQVVRIARLASYTVMLWL